MGVASGVRIPGRPNGERRRHYRARATGPGALGVRVGVRLRRLDGVDAGWTKAEADDLGVGGAFVIGGELPPGTLVEIEVDVVAPEGGRIGARGHVRWRSEDDERPGIGIAFAPLDAESMLALSELLAASAQGSGDER